MKQPIPIPTTSEKNGSTVHGAALMLFGWTRKAVAYAAEIPAVAEQAADDIVRAWHESGAQQRPKA